jgi:hypothetical protein
VFLVTRRDDGGCVAYPTRRGTEQRYISHVCVSQHVAGRPLIRSQTTTEPSLWTGAQPHDIGAAHFPTHQSCKASRNNMTKINDITVNGRNISIYRATGEVAHFATTSSVQVSGGGGGGYINQGSGHVSVAPVTSTTTFHHQLFIQTDEGHEEVVELTSAKTLMVRQGHRVSVLWGIAQGRDKGPYCALHNHSIGGTELSPKAIGNLANPDWLQGVAGLGVIVGIVAGVVTLFRLFAAGPFHFGVIVSGAIAVGGFYIGVLVRRNVTTFRNAIEETIARLR